MALSRRSLISRGALLVASGFLAPSFITRTALALDGTAGRGRRCHARCHQEEPHPGRPAALGRQRRHQHADSVRRPELQPRCDPTLGVPDQRRAAADRRGRPAPQPGQDSRRCTTRARSPSSRASATRTRIARTSAAWTSGIRRDPRRSSARAGSAATSRRASARRTTRCPRSASAIS